MKHGARRDSTKIRRGRGIEVPSGEYTASSLAVALQFALNGRGLEGRLPFSGSGEASGSEYIVTATGSRLMISLGEEVVSGLDEFAILPEGNLRNVRFVPDFVAEGGPSFNAGKPRSLINLFNHMGTWHVTERYSQAAWISSGAGAALQRPPRSTWLVPGRILPMTSFG